jgi:hypothetical protein
VGVSDVPERSPHRLADALVTDEGFCAECRSQMTGQHVKIESDDGRKSIKLGRADEIIQ